MTAEEAIEWGKPLSFEKVWAMFAETDRKYAETVEIIREVGRKQAKTEELLAQQKKNIDQVSNEIRETNRSAYDRLAQLEKNVDRVSNNVGGLNRSIGELVETLIAARLWEKFPQFGLARAYQRLPLYDENNQIKTDIDILLVNTDMCMAVEVKHKLNRMDEVDGHLKRMRLIRQYPPEQIGSKQLLGAMAGGAVDPDVKDYAYKSGFFVLELTGESVHLIPPPDGFEPKKW
ncbi:MAG: hypothetical protein LBG57_14265 [Treponema sp.]|jgi:hypothetical protein|nr:hypothetical protein [Treponema sp.]